MPTRMTFLATILTVTTATRMADAQQAPPAAVPGPSAGNWSQTIGEVRDLPFVVSLIDDTQVAARENGVLTSLDAREGEIVEKDAILARIDDSDAQIRRLIAENELHIAIEQAESDADLKAAQATVGVAKAEYDGSQDITGRSSNAISAFEVRRLKLTHDRSVYQAINAEVQHRINDFSRTMREAQLQAVDQEIDRRLIQSPINGVVVRRFRHLGDWIKVGEPVYRVVRMDRLRVEGLLSSQRFTPAQVQGRRVDIQVEIPDGRTPQGKETITIENLMIDFASPVVDAGRDFLVFADFDNPVDANGHWLIRPGLEARVTIYLGEDMHRSTAGR